MNNTICNNLKIKYSNTTKRFLSIDYGSKNIGIAISDVGRQIATPYTTIENKNLEYVYKELDQIIKQMDVAVIVIGLPLQMNGEEGETVNKVKSFTEFIKKQNPNIDICFIDERLTSKLVEKFLINDFNLSRNKRKQIIDKLAATQILQTMLDMK